MTNEKFIDEWARFGPGPEAIEIKLILYMSRGQRSCHCFEIDFYFTPRGQRSCQLHRSNPFEQYHKYMSRCGPGPKA